MEQNNSLALLDQNMPTLTQLLLVNMPAGTTEQEAKRKALREIMNVEAIFSTKPELMECDAQSVVLVVKQCIADNLTLAPAAGLVYLYPQKIQVGTDPSNNSKIYKQVLVYDPTAEGRISIARQAGSILDHRRPECKLDHDGKVESVSFTFLVPSFGGARWETVTFGVSDFEKWKQKSAAKFGGNANGNYTSWKGGIDPEFAGSKAIRHALKKLGTNKNEVRNISFAPAHQQHNHIEQQQFIEPSKILKIEDIAAPLKQLHQQEEQTTTTHNAEIVSKQSTNNSIDINPNDL